MKKKEIVKSNSLFNNIIQKGEKISNKYYIICSLEKEKINPNFGIAIGKKVGNAVTRNKIKRQLRNIIDSNKKAFPINKNYIIICKKEVLNLSFREKEKKLIELLPKGDNQ